MTRRLQYTRDAFLRRVAMSYDASVFVLVEGKVFDPYFAEQLCATSAKLRKAGYEIRLISQVKTDSGLSAGGKDAVISFFDYCKRNDRLRQRNAGGDRVVAFMVDRDCQHITGGMRRSPHVIYTLYADVEAHIFFDADELEALSLAASLDSATGMDLFQALGDWRRTVADTWRPWIELCCIADATRSRCWVGFGSPKSLIHDGKRCGVINSKALAEASKAVRDSSPLAGAVFDSRKDLVLSRIASTYRTRKQASLLKGKWLPIQLTFLVDDFFKSGAKGEHEWHAKGFKESIDRCYAANLLRDAPGFRHMRAQLEAVL